MKTILILLLIFSVPAFFASYQKRFEQLLAPTVFAISILLMLGGVVDLLLPTLYLTVGLLFVILVFALIRMVKNPKIFVENMFTPAFFILLLWLVVIFATQSSRLIVAWDEYTHWGLTVKAMNYYDKLGSFDIVPTVYKDYPPATAVFGYFWTRLAGFTEPGMIGSFTFMILSMLIIGLKNVTWKKWKFALCYGAVVPLLPMLFFPQTYTSVLIDPMISVCFAYIILVALLEKEYNKLKNAKIILGLIVLTMLKTTGILAAVFAAIFVAMDYFNYKKNEFKKERFDLETQLDENEYRQKCKKRREKAILFSILFIAVPIITQLVWVIHTGIVDTGVVFSPLDVTVDGVIKAFTGRGLDYQTQTIKSYMTELFNMKLYGQKFTFIGVTTGLLALSAVIRLLIQDREERKRFDRSNLINHIWGIVYILATLIAYLFTFRESEALALSCFDRYVSIFPAGTIIILVIYLYHYVLGSKHTHSNHFVSSIVLVMTAIIIAFFPGKVVIDHYTATYVTGERKKIEEKAQIVLEKTLETDKVFLVAQKSNGFEYFITKYYLLPRNANSILTFNIGHVDESIGDGKRTISDVEHFEEILRDYHYTHVFLAKYNTSLWSKFGELFEPVENYKEARLFKIVKDDNNNIKLLAVQE